MYFICELKKVFYQNSFLKFDFFRKCADGVSKSLSNIDLAALFWNFIMESIDSAELFPQMVQK